MDWQAALRARLVAAAPVTALVGSRIYWVDRPQASALPAITLQTISDDRPQHMKGFIGLNPARVQVDKRDLGERVETQFIHRASIDFIIHHAAA